MLAKKKYRNLPNIALVNAFTIGTLKSITSAFFYYHLTNRCFVLEMNIKKGSNRERESESERMNDTTKKNISFGTFHFELIKYLHYRSEAND